MEQFWVVLGQLLGDVAVLFPVVAGFALLIRYIVEAAQKYAGSKNPARLQAILNMAAWLAVGIAAKYGAEGQVLDVVKRFTEAWPGLLGLLELAIPVFVGILATKKAHDLLKLTEGARPK